MAETRTPGPDRVDAPAASPPRRVLASFESYAEAERLVDHLSDEKFPVEHTAIVGTGVKLEEQVTGRIGRRESITRGGSSGALIGALLGLIFGIFDWVDPLIAGLLLALYGLVFGAVIGALTGWALHAGSGGRRDFGSVMGMRAERYEVLVDDNYYESAARLAEKLDAGGTGEQTTRDRLGESQGG